MWWQQYRKTFIPTQLFILTICAVAIFGCSIAPVSVLSLFAVMEACSALGALWSVRLRNKIERARSGRDRLPPLMV